MKNNTKKQFLIAIVLIAVLLVITFLLGGRSDIAIDETLEENKVGEFESLDITKSVVMDSGFDYLGLVLDVTAGETFRGVNTEGMAEGAVEARFEDGKYELRATFVNLPDPQNTDFYEGWIVRKGANMDVISTGSLSRIDNEWVNVFEYDTDITDHTFYVVTLEPADGNPAPSEHHILEGDLERS